MKTKPKSKLLIAGGGTGGHILAGVAIADAWKARIGSSSQVLFIGAKRGLEEKLVPKAGYPLVSLRIGTLNGVSLGRKLKTLFQLPWAFLVAVLHLLKFRPDCIIGVGGYSSGPVVMSAALLRWFHLLSTRISLLEQNSVLGLTNRILAKRADCIFLVFSEMARLFPKKEVYVTGNPIRSSMVPMPSADREPFVVFIFGGSQGARGINQRVVESLSYFKKNAHRIEFVHQTGEADFETVSQAYREAGLRARVEKFIFDMPEVYKKASLVICRAGSSTLAEIAAVGRASILIPLPTAADQHQEKNALAYSEAGAAMVLNQLKTNGFELASQVFQTQGCPGRRSRVTRP
ncbi:MAG: undecaprenyldiphospho-muramoylpentapeptide beta-N-acetylglucosaminyltransferase [Bdellovibrio sp.]|nr:undecaprenyldiphospho-muramoylpentapeptide beta-N-acetylglucosaminyltransferase [Bdellovibrio sp.]